ncbi:MAG: phosphoglycerate dehydrogenase, partial [candidate division WOR-3 bacterium]
MKVIITDPIAPEGVKILREAGFTVDEKPGIAPDELLKVIPEYDAIIVRRATKVTAEVIEAG